VACYVIDVALHEFSGALHPLELARISPPPVWRGAHRACVVGDQGSWMRPFLRLATSARFFSRSSFLRSCSRLMPFSASSSFFFFSARRRAT
jgi:hypothetical protein